MPEAMSITCPVCWHRSYHPHDVQHGYCARCHAFTSERSPRFAHFSDMELVVVQLALCELGMHPRLATMGENSALALTDLTNQVRTETVARGIMPPLQRCNVASV